MTRGGPRGAEKLKLGVLASGRGSNFEALHDSILYDHLPAVIQVVITDQPQAPVLEKARNRDIPGFYVNPAQFAGRQPYEAELVRICRTYGVELVVLAGFMRILKDTFIQAFPQRVINVHPSLLPSFAGLHAHRQALDYGVKFSGCTVHFVDLGVDTGPVILQQSVPVMQDDDEDSLADRILQQEHLLLPQAVRLIAEGRIKVCRRRVNILPKEESTVNKRALVSVSNKEGVVDFAQGLEKLGWDIISTGGTYELLKKAGVKVSKVADVTGFPEILDGRVKTLHPKIHGGILARRIPDHMQQLAENAIEPIDMVAVNLYPFRETIKKPGVELEEAIENIDIGGPTMIRSAAKNYQDVLVVVSPDDYSPILEELSREGGVTPDLRFKLAHKAFAHTAFYDSMIADYLGGLRGDNFPDVLIWGGEKLQEMRYGENPHQGAAFYRAALASGGLPVAKQLNGKELSYNNVIDAEAAFALVREFDEPACVIIKHTNPCGAAIGNNLEEAWDRAFNADPVSAFGGIIAFNREVDQATAKKAAEPFMEVIIAPGYEAEALATLQSRKNLRVLELGMDSSPGLQMKSVVGGMVVQDLDTTPLDLNSLNIVTKKQPTPEELQEMVFAWKVVKHVKSNAIVVTKDGTTLGVGAGQMNRVGSAKLALEQAGDRSRGAVLASDAFFPFKDTVELAGQYGINAIIQTGGSVRDQESIDECDRLGIAMVFTNVRHFRH